MSPLVLSIVGQEIEGLGSVVDCRRWVLPSETQEHMDQPDEAKGRAMVKFLWWATHEGQQYPKDLLYAPLPPTVVKRIEATLREIRFQGKPLLTAAQ